MDLALSNEQEHVGRAVRAQFGQRNLDVRWPTGAVEQVVVGFECGRAAAPVALHGGLLAHLLGWRGATPVSAGIAARPGTAPLVPGGLLADRFVIAVSEDEALDLAADEVERIHKPALDDPESCTVRFEDGRGLLRAAPVRAAAARAALIRAADAVGAAEAAFEYTLAHVQRRLIKGEPLARLQTVRHRCADMHIDIVTARDAIFAAAGVCDRTGSDEDVSIAIAMAKTGATERAVRVTAAAHQLAGGLGIMADSPLHLWYRRARAAQLVLGDTRHHLEVIARSLLGPADVSDSG